MYVTFDELISFATLICAIISLVIFASSQRKKIAIVLHSKTDYSVQNLARLTE